MSKKILSVVLALVMVVSCLAVSAFAGYENDEDAALYTQTWALSSPLTTATAHGQLTYPLQPTTPQVLFSSLSQTLITQLQLLSLQRLAQLSPLIMLQQSALQTQQVRLSSFLQQQVLRQSQLLLSTVLSQLLPTPTAVQALLQSLSLTTPKQKQMLQALLSLPVWTTVTLLQAVS